MKTHLLQQLKDQTSATCQKCAWDPTGYSAEDTPILHVQAIVEGTTRSRRRGALKQSFHWAAAAAGSRNSGVCWYWVLVLALVLGRDKCLVIHFKSTRTFTDNDIIQESAHYSRKKYISGSTRQRTSPRCIPPYEVADSEAGIASSNNALPPERGG